MATKRAGSREELKRQIKGRRMSDSVGNPGRATTPSTPKIGSTSRSPAPHTKMTTAQRISHDIRRAWGKARPVKIGQKRK